MEIGIQTSNCRDGVLCTEPGTSCQECHTLFQSLTTPSVNKNVGRLLTGTDYVKASLG